MDSWNVFAIQRGIHPSVVVSPLRSASRSLPASGPLFFHLLSGRAPKGDYKCTSRPGFSPRKKIEKQTTGRSLTPFSFSLGVGLLFLLRPGKRRCQGNLFLLPSRATLLPVLSLGSLPKKEKTGKRGEISYRSANISFFSFAPGSLHGEGKERNGTSITSGVSM